MRHMLISVPGKLNDYVQWSNCRSGLVIQLIFHISQVMEETPLISDVKLKLIPVDNDYKMWINKYSVSSAFSVTNIQFHYY